MRIIELRQRHMRLCDNSKTQDPFECKRCVKKINEDISKLDAKWFSNEDLTIINTVKLATEKQTNLIIYVQNTGKADCTN